MFIGELNAVAPTHRVSGVNVDSEVDSSGQGWRLSINISTSVAELD